MTPGELAVWRAVYAVAWFQPTSRVTPGHVTDRERARAAIEQANRAVIALRESAAKDEYVGWSREAIE